MQTYKQINAGRKTIICTKFAPAKIFKRFKKKFFRLYQVDMGKKMAEEVGFEPTVPCGTTVFKTAAFNHSAIPPRASEF